jgi:hypothetical protein
MLSVSDISRLGCLLKPTYTVKHVCRVEYFYYISYYILNAKVSYWKMSRRILIRTLKHGNRSNINTMPVQFAIMEFC